MSRSKGAARVAACLVTYLVACLAPPGAAHGHASLEALTRRIRGGPHLQVKAATFLGGKGIEEFVGVAGAPDGRIVVFGNSWGPELPPAGVRPHVIGRGRRLDVNEFVTGEPTGRGGQPAGLDLNCPNRAGFVAFFSGDATRLERLVAFDWNVAAITAGAVAADGGLVISGRSQHAFRELARGAGVSNSLAPPPGAPGAKFGPLVYQDERIAGDGYVARLSPDGSRIEWAWVFEGHRASADRLWLMEDGSVAFELKGLRRVSADGREHRELRLEGGCEGRARVLAVSPSGGTVLRGGAADTNAGHESGTGGAGRRLPGPGPWRKPLLLGYGPGGKWLWQIYDWDAGLVRHYDFRLVADSEVRAAEYAPDGTVCVCGWSAGVHSVFMRNPVDLEKAVPAGGLGARADEAQLGSFSHLIRLDLDGRYEVIRHALFAAFAPPADGGQGRPTSPRIERLCPLSDGSLAFSGETTSRLAQTPGPWGRVPELAEEYEAKGLAPPGTGQFVAVLDRDFANLPFCHAVPGSEVTGIAEVKGGIAVVCRTAGPTAGGGEMPSVRATQPAFGGGRYDGHLLLLEKP